MPSRQSPRRSPPRRLNRSPRQLLSLSLIHIYTQYTYAPYNAYWGDYYTIQGDGAAAEMCIRDRDDTPYEIHDKAVVYTFKTGILKKGQDGNTEKLLNGVTFDLYKKYDANTDKLKENTTDTVIFGVKECRFLTAADAKALGLNETEAEKMCIRDS